MKVITKCVIDIETGQILEEESHEYQGPVALCDFGGGGGASADNTAAAMAQAMAIQQEMYNKSRKDLRPYREVGEATTPFYAGMLNVPGYESVDPTNTLRDTPGYNWMMDQGVEAIDRSAAGKGMLSSGAMGKGLIKFGQGLADQSYNNYMNRLYNLMGTGQNAAAQTGQFGSNMANQVGNYLMMGGQAQDQAALYNAQNSNSGWNSMLGGLGLLGGIALSPAPPEGWKNTLAGSLFK